MSSRGSLRVQLSLLLDDEQLYDGFIIPMKENKELNSFVIKLLSSYFYNDEVRALVDNSSAEDMQNESEQDDHIAGMFSNAQQLLACMSAMEDIALDEFENGIKSMTNMMDDVAEKTGGTRSSQTDFGVSAPQINTRFLIEQNQNSGDKNTEHTNEEGTSNDLVMKLLEKYDERISGIEDAIKSIAIKVGASDVKFEDKAEIMSETVVTQVPQEEVTQASSFTEETVVEHTEPIKEDVVPEIVSPTVSSEQSFVAETSNTSEVKEEVSQAPIDGSDILANLIKNAEDIFG